MKFNHTGWKKQEDGSLISFTVSDDRYCVSTIYPNELEKNKGKHLENLKAIKHKMAIRALKEHDG